VRRHLGAALGGLALGAALTRIGFWDWSQVHAMFTFRDLRLFLVFAGALAVCSVGFLALRVPRPAGRIGGGMLIGAALFGAGWALTGACPGAALVQLGNGYLPALASLAGIGVGFLLHRKIGTRLLGAPPDTCGR
jgi:uncharacterized protein